MKERRSQTSEVRSQKKVLFVAFFCFLLSAFCLLPTQWACARHVSSTELVENPRFYDGKTITYQGEAVGDVMIRGENAWIHVNDDRYSVLSSNQGKRLVGYNTGHGVWLKASEANEIIHLGGYKESGDIVRVEGVFNQACSLHDGAMDIHAEKLDVVERGAPFEYVFDVTRAITAAILGLLSVGLYFLYGIVEKKRTQQSMTQ